MNQVLEWIKANVFIVIFGLLMIGALVALPFFSSAMSVDVKKKVEERAKLNSKLKALEKTDIAPPLAEKAVAGVPGLVNELLLTQYRVLASEMRSDADGVIQAALDFNRKNHSLMMEGVFPEMPRQAAEVLPKRFHEAMVVAYDQLMEKVNVGMPPGIKELAGELHRAEMSFISQSVQKDSREDLDPQELEELTKKLTEVRLAKNREHAEQIGFYLDRDRALSIVPWNQGRLPTEAYMFTWNLKYWVVHDVLMALHHANSGNQNTVLRAPVKRVVSLLVDGMPEVTRSATPVASRTPGGRGRSSGASSGAADSEDEDPATGTPIDPQTPVAIDYGYRFTGRNTNALYDVFEVRLEIIVDSTRIPEVLDKISQENFFTVVNLEVTPVDPFVEASKGFMYGNAPLSRLNLTIDTVWLRQWTSEHMPEEVLVVLGIALPKPPPEDA